MSDSSDCSSEAPLVHGKGCGEAAAGANGDGSEDGSKNSWQRRLGPAKRVYATRVAVAACALAAAAAFVGWSRNRRPLPAALLRGGEEAAPLLGLEEEPCQDTVNWTNGWVACRDEVLGDDPALCTPKGWTCAGYLAKGLCGQGDPKPFAMGPGLNSPEKNCCACKGFKRGGECNVDTGGTCFISQRCDGWRGAAKCVGGYCHCRTGYCASSGTCKLGARNAYMQRTNASEGGAAAFAAPQCSRVTSGSCVLPTSHCSPYRGPTTCNGGQCVCTPGHCTDLSGMCFKDMGTIHARVHPVSGTSTPFPGPVVRTALCVSGGGSRSMSAALGQFRALHHLGLLQNVDLISSVSGGSWASSILTFANMSLDELLGSTTTPGSLTLSALDATPAPLGAVLMNKSSDIASKLHNKHVPLRTLWVETVGHAFLEPFGLYDLESFMAATSADAERIKAANPQYKSSRFLVPQPGRAKSFVMGGTLCAPDGFKTSGQNALSFQMSPDFTGSPYYPGNHSLDYEPTQAGLPKLDDVLVGGGFVESFAFGGPAPPQRIAQMGGDDVTLAAPSAPFSLARAVGISSCAFAGMATQIINAGQKLNPQAYVWPVTSATHPRPQQALPYQLGDGGNIENTGLLQALQRGATKLVVLLNTDKKMSSHVDFCKVGRDHNPHGQVTSDLATLFGYCESSSLVEFHEHNRVFDPAEFFPLLCDFQLLRQDGKPTIVRRSLVVQPNAWWGIPGGATVDVVFFMLQRAFSFEDALPADTRNALTSGPLGGFSNFPNYQTCFQNFPDLTRYTARQVNLLAAQTEWSVLLQAQLFREVLT